MLLEHDLTHAEVEVFSLVGDATADPEADQVLDAAVEDDDGWYPPSTCLTAAIKGPAYCIRTGCHSRRSWRGMCASCAADAAQRVMRGEVTWEQLEAVSRALPDARPMPRAIRLAADPVGCVVPGCQHPRRKQRALCMRCQAQADRLVQGGRFLSHDEAVEAMIAAGEGR